MPVTIAFGNSRAYILNGKWYSSDKTLAAEAQALTDPNQVGAHEPDPDEALALLVAPRLGAEVVALNPPDETPLEPGAVF